MLPSEPLVFPPQEPPNNHQPTRNGRNSESRLVPTPQSSSSVWVLSSLLSHRSPSRPRASKQAPVTFGELRIVPTVSADHTYTLLPQRANPRRWFAVLELKGNLINHRLQTDLSSIKKLLLLQDLYQGAGGGINSYSDGDPSHLELSPRSTPSFASLIAIALAPSTFVLIRLGFYADFPVASSPIS